MLKLGTPPVFMYGMSYESWLIIIIIPAKPRDSNTDDDEADQRWRPNNRHQNYYWKYALSRKRL